MAHKYWKVYGKIVGVMGHKKRSTISGPGSKRHRRKMKHEYLKKGK